MATEDQMLAEHQQMWNNFCKIITAAIIGVVVVLGGMGLFLL